MTKAESLPSNFEECQSKRSRLNSQVIMIGSIFFLCIFIGLPLWLSTTTPFRASLDIPKMRQEIKFFGSIDLKVVIVGETAPTSAELLQFKKDLNGFLQRHSDFHLSNDERNTKLDWSLEVSPLIKSFDNSETLQNIDLNLRKFQKELFPNSTNSSVYTCFVIESAMAFSNDQKAKIFIGNNRNAFVPHKQKNSDSGALVSVVTEAFANLLPDLIKKQGINAPHLNNIVFPSASSYHVSFSILCGDSGINKISWNYGSLIKDFIKPTFTLLDPQLNVSFDFQTLYHVSLRKEIVPIFIDNSNSRCIEESKMGLFLNPESWNMAQVQDAISINFVIYIPDKDVGPLHFCSVNDSSLRSNSYVIPRWGGVILCNTKTMSPWPKDMSGLTKFSLSIDEGEMEEIQKIFTNQLHRLLGIAPVIKPDIVHYNTSKALSQWQIDVFQRRVIFQNSQKTMASLSSLALLLKKIPNIIISEQLSKHVSKAMRNVEKATKSFLVGNMSQSLKESHIAFDYSELAFFDPSMIELLYFPDDNKFAIYMPLFLPCVVTCFAIIKKMICNYRNDQI